MQSFKLKFFLFLLLPVAGFILGRYSITSEIQVSDSKKTISVTSCNSKLDTSTKDLQNNFKGLQNEVKKSRDINVDHFDEYEHNLKYEESLQEWNDSLDLFFKDNFEIDSDKLQKEYLILKGKLKKELDQEWEVIQESTRTGENEFLFNTTYQQDLRRLEIRSKYHKKLKNLLGSKKYERLQKKIKMCKENQVKKARNNLAHGHCPNF